MLEVSVPNLTKSMGSTVHYNIHIKDGNSQVRLSSLGLTQTETTHLLPQTETTHRYSEFETLHKALVKQFGDSVWIAVSRASHLTELGLQKVVGLPGKKLLGNMSDKFVEERR